MRRRSLASPGPAHTQIAFLPTSTEELSIPLALLFTKDKTHGIIMIDSDSNGKVNIESK